MRARAALGSMAVAAVGGGTIAVVRRCASSHDGMQAGALEDEGLGYPLVVRRFDGFETLHTASFAAVRDLVPTDLLHPVRAPNGRALVLLAFYRKYAVTAGVGDAMTVLPPYAELPVIAVVSRRPMSIAASVLAQLTFDSELGGYPIQFPMTSRHWRDMVRRESGMPAFVADVAVDVSHGGPWRVRVSEGDDPLIRVAVSSGGVLRESSMSQTLFGVVDGELLGARTELRLVGRMRLGGGSLSFGSEHPVARALRTLDIAPRAVMTLRFAGGEVVLHRPAHIGPARPLACHPGIDERDGIWMVRYPDCNPIAERAEASSAG